MKWYQTFSKLPQKKQMNIIKFITGVVVLTTIMCAATASQASIDPDPERNRTYWLTTWLDNTYLIGKGELSFKECRRQRLEVLEALRRYKSHVSVTCTLHDPLSVIEL